MSELSQGSLLKKVVKITYPKESLTEKEVKDMGRLPYVRYIYFYSSNEADYERIMNQAWRPGATCEIYPAVYRLGITRRAGKKKGEWI